MSRRGLCKFDTLLLTDDGGRYSPSIRRLRQHYLNDIKSFPEKIFSTQMNNSQSSIDLLSRSFKCDECQKHDGLFQCCHCNQRLCIRCCNKHYKKVTNELEHLHELTDRLLTKIFHIKIDLERQKNEIIEQCQKWRIDTINTINQAHTLIIQTIHDEYEILSKEYEFFVEKEMSYINIDKNQLIKMKKTNLGSLLSSPLSKTTTINSKKSMETIKQHIETFAKRIDDKGKFSFQVKLPKFDIDDNLRVESCFGDVARSTSAIWQNEDTPSTESEKISKNVNDEIRKDPSSNSEVVNPSHPNDSPSLEIDLELQSEHYDSTYGTASSSSNNSLPNQYEESFPIPTNQFTRRHTHTSHPTSLSNKNEDTYQSTEHVQIEQSKKNDGIIQRHRTSIQACGIRRRTTDIPVHSSSSLLNKDRLSKNYPWLFSRTNSTPSFIE